MVGKCAEVGGVSGIFVKRSEECEAILSLDDLAGFSYLRHFVFAFLLARST